MGWLCEEQGIPAQELRLQTLLPSSGREGVSLAFDYCQFLLNERQVSPNTQGVPAPEPVLLVVRICSCVYWPIILLRDMQNTPGRPSSKSSLLLKAR